MKIPRSYVEKTVFRVLANVHNCKGFMKMSINRIDTNVQNMQCQITTLAESMDTTSMGLLISNLLKEAYPPPTDPAIPDETSSNRSSTDGISRLIATDQVSSEQMVASEEIKVLVLMDSNGKNIKPDKF